MDTKTKKKVVMICTAGRGGMRAVVEGYRASGLFSRWNVVLLNSNIEGSFIVRLSMAARAFSRLIGLLLSRQVSLVHCHSAMRTSFWRKSLFALTSRLAGVPVVFHLHGSEMKTFVNGKSAIVRGLIAKILAKQSVVIVLSDSWLEFVKSVSPSANVRVLPNYVELPEVLEGPADGGNAGIEVLFLGVVGARKGVYDLLPAFGDAVAQVPRLHLTVGGNGAVDEARTLAVELGIETHIVFAGWVSGEMKTELLRKSDIYVLPSYDEGLPVGLLEAMSWAIPVVSTRVGGIPELVRDGVDGLLIDAGDRAALSSALIELGQNADLRQRMGVAGRSQVEHEFSRKVVLPKLENLYHSLIFGNNANL